MHGFLPCLLVLPLSAQTQSSQNPVEMAEVQRFVAARFGAPSTNEPRSAGLVIAFNNGAVEQNIYRGKQLKIGDQEFTRGLACHAASKIQVRLPSPGKTFFSKIGLDHNEQTHSGQGSINFSVRCNGSQAFASGIFRVTTPAEAIEVGLQGALEFTLEVGDAGDGIGWDQADWADAQVELKDGTLIGIGDLPIHELEEGLFCSDPPFSFEYDGKSSSDFLESWPVSRSSRALDDQRTSHTVIYSEPSGPLQIRCEIVVYHDYPSVEWTLHFKNTGETDTPILQNIQSLDLRWQRERDSEFLLHHNVGSPADGTDYSAQVSVLSGAMSKRFGAAGGRSTNAHLSYFNLERSPEDGLIAVVGWPGQWAATFTRDVDLGIRVAAGQEWTHFILLPHEEIRTPLSVLQFWHGGDWIRAQNVWRRWMIAHNVPRPGGKLPQPMLLAYSGGAYEEMYRATEETQLMWFNRYLEEKIPLDYWWMDAGWYRCDPVGWPKVGTWEVDTQRFPRGLRPITDYVHAHGMKTLLWFEPERVAEGTWLADNKAEWILGGSRGGILDFGNPEALQWITDSVDTVLTHEGIDLYRQDFNTDPLGAWRAADAQDRQGITEIRHVTNLLAYWDELQRRHPNMLMDECASGGRRNDLEMMRRAVPMWRSDRTMEPNGQQSMTHGISMWIPFFGTGTVAWGDAAYFITGNSPIEPYGFWSSACPSLNLLFDVRERHLDYDKIRELTAQWREVMPYYYGDYYPLSTSSLDPGDWMAWQFDRPEPGDGIVQVFRRSQSIYEAARLPLRGLSAEANYEITRIGKVGQAQFSGKELLEKGLPVSLDERPSAAIFRYRLVQN